MFHFASSKVLKLAAFTALLSIGAAAEAAAFSRTVSGSGPNGGTYTRQGSGGCSNGSCNWNSTTTGPNGLTSSHNASAVRNGNGSVSVTGSGTGPYGQSYNRSATYSRY